MFTTQEYDKVLDYYFQNKKFKTPNRMFFETVLEHSTVPNMKFSTPWTVSWQVVSQCNLRCKHCFFEGDNKLYDSSNDLNSTNLISLADELINDLNIVSLSITGGETLLREDIFELLSKIKRNNITVSLQTNATLIDDIKAKKLAQILNPNMDFVQVSLDGSNSNIYDLIRGKNTFNKALNGIEHLLNNDIKLNVNTTVTQLNKNDIFNIYQFCNKLDIKKYSVSKFIPCNPQHENLSVNIEPVIKQFAKIIDLENEKNTFFEMNYRFYDFLSNENLRTLTDNYLKRNANENVCNADVSCHKHNTLYINAKGEVYLCFACENKEHVLGTYPQSSMTEIWANRHNNIFFKPRLISNLDCKKCKYFVFCKGGCMGYAFDKYKKTSAPDGLCEYAKLTNIKSKKSS